MDGEDYREDLSIYAWDSDHGRTQFYIPPRTTRPVMSPRKAPQAVMSPRQEQPAQSIPPVNQPPSTFPPLPVPTMQSFQPMQAMQAMQPIQPMQPMQSFQPMQTSSPIPTTHMEESNITDRTERRRTMQSDIHRVPTRQTWA